MITFKGWKASRDSGGVLVISCGYSDVTDEKYLLRFHVDLDALPSLMEDFNRNDLSYAEFKSLVAKSACLYYAEFLAEVQQAGNSLENYRIYHALTDYGEVD